MCILLFVVNLFSTSFFQCCQCHYSAVTTPQQNFNQFNADVWKREPDARYKTQDKRFDVRRNGLHEDSWSGTRDAERRPELSLYAIPDAANFLGLAKSLDKLEQFLRGKWIESKWNELTMKWRNVKKANAQNVKKADGQNVKEAEKQSVRDYSVTSKYAPKQKITRTKLDPSEVNEMRVRNRRGDAEYQEQMQLGKQQMLKDIEDTELTRGDIRNYKMDAVTLEAKRQQVEGRARMVLERKEMEANELKQPKPVFDRYAKLPWEKHRELQEEWAQKRTREVMEYLRAHPLVKERVMGMNKKSELRDNPLDNWEKHRNRQLESGRKLKKREIADLRFDPTKMKNTEPTYEEEVELQALEAKMRQRKDTFAKGSLSRNPSHPDPDRKGLPPWLETRMKKPPTWRDYMHDQWDFGKEQTEREFIRIRDKINKLSQRGLLRTRKFKSGTIYRDDSVAGRFSAQSQRKAAMEGTNTKGDAHLRTADGGEDSPVVDNAKKPAVDELKETEADKDVGGVASTHQGPAQDEIFDSTSALKESEAKRLETTDAAAKTDESPNRITKDREQKPEDQGEKPKKTVTLPKKKVIERRLTRVLLSNEPPGSSSLKETVKKKSKSPAKKKASPTHTTTKAIESEENENQKNNKGLKKKRVVKKLASSSQKNKQSEKVKRKQKTDKKTQSKPKEVQLSKEGKPQSTDKGKESLSTSTDSVKDDKTSSENNFQVNNAKPKISSSIAKNDKKQTRSSRNKKSKKQTAKKSISLSKETRSINHDEIPKPDTTTKQSTKSKAKTKTRASSKNLKAVTHNDRRKSSTKNKKSSKQNVGRPKKKSVIQETRPLENSDPYVNKLNVNKPPKSIKGKEEVVKIDPALLKDDGETFETPPPLSPDDAVKTVREVLKELKKQAKESNYGILVGGYRGVVDSKRQLNVVHKRRVSRPRGVGTQKLTSEDVARRRQIRRRRKAEEDADFEFGKQTTKKTNNKKTRPAKILGIKARPLKRRRTRSTRKKRKSTTS